MGSTTSGLAAPHTTPQTPRTDFPVQIIALQVQHRDVHHPAGLPSCVTPSLPSGGTGILTCCPSPTPFGLSLGPTNPTRINLPSETSDFRWICFSHIFRYSYQHSHFCRPQSLLSVRLVSPTERSPTIRLNGSAASVVCLSPVTFSAQNHLTSELLRTL